MKLFKCDDVEDYCEYYSEKKQQQHIAVTAGLTEHYSVQKKYYCYYSSCYYFEIDHPDAAAETATELGYYS
jgi:hypothetical protein